MTETSYAAFFKGKVDIKKLHRSIPINKVNMAKGDRVKSTSHLLVSTSHLAQVMVVPLFLPGGKEVEL
jgi:hypothetical protein